MSVSEVGPIAHQPAGCRELAPLVDRGYRVTNRLLDDLSTLAGEKGVAANDEAAGPELDKSSKGGHDLARGARPQDTCLQPSFYARARA